MIVIASHGGVTLIDNHSIHTPAVGSYGDVLEAPAPSVVPPG